MSDNWPFSVFYLLKWFVDLSGQKKLGPECMQNTKKSSLVWLQAEESSIWRRMMVWIDGIKASIVRRTIEL